MRLTVTRKEAEEGLFRIEGMIDTIRDIQEIMEEYMDEYTRPDIHFTEQGRAVRELGKYLLGEMEGVINKCTGLSDALDWDILSDILRGGVK